MTSYKLSTFFYTFTSHNFYFDDVVIPFNTSLATFLILVDDDGR
jgi:hypothetical protein